MTLNRHKIEGLTAFNCTVIDSNTFENLMIQAGYSISGSAPAQSNRIKVWWIHNEYARVESVYSPDKRIVITAYHVN